MAERENLPAVIAAQTVAVQTEKRGSLVARGMAAVLSNTQPALTKDNDALANLTPEQEQKLLLALTKLFDAAFRKGYCQFKEAARFVLNAIKAKFGAKVSDQISLDILQCAYIGMAGRYEDEGADKPCDVVAVESKKELEESNVTGAEIYRDGVTMGGAFIESGIFSYDAYSNAMVGELGDAIKPYLRGIYESLRHYPGFDSSQMTPASEVDASVGLYKSAELGDACMLWQRGEMCSNGFKDRGPLGTSKVCEILQNDEEAEYWYRKSAETGDCFYQWQLGELYSEGRGVAQNYEQAAYWYSKAAEQGDWYFQNKLGWMYNEGRVVEQNDELAVYWFRRAAEEGDVGAQESLKILGIDWKK